MSIAYIAFTDRGEALAKRLSEETPGSVWRCVRDKSLQEWTAEAFARAEGLVFVGAAGIAVRAIAPHVKSKAQDPAVVAVDETGRWAVPLLSGHLGGANGLARRLAKTCGGQAVITTATDCSGLFAADSWARKQGCAVADTANIKGVSGALLAGQTVRLYSQWPIEGGPPAGVVPVQEGQDCEVCVSFAPPQNRETLWLIPRTVVLGIGCRKGTPQERLEQALQDFLRQGGLPLQAVRCVASIDLKAEEPGLKALCAAHGWRLFTYPAALLRQARGRFTPSAFVARTVGVDNVCERAAAVCSGGEICIPKTAGQGVTMAAAMIPFVPDWSWNE